MVSMAENVRGKATALCNGWKRRGHCVYGTSCRFLHSGPAGVPSAPGDPAPGNGMYCDYHKSRSHTSDCRDKPSPQQGGRQAPQQQR